MKRTKKNLRPIAVIDIDGTIAKVGERGKLLHCTPVDWERFYNDSFDDEPIIDVCNMVIHLSRRCEIFFCTSRSERVRQKTQLWLLKTLGMTPKDYTLIMRPDKDERPDYVQKIDTFCTETTEEERKRVECIIEDSIAVAWHWRQLGYTCYNVL